MNRRNFFTTLVALPVIGAAVKALGIQSEPSKKVIMSTTYGKMEKNWYILSPKEIMEAGFVLVTTPTFMSDDQVYCIKTKKLTLWLPPERVEAFTSGSERDGFKQEAIKQIKAGGFTHVHSVKFNESPLYNVTTCESLGHMAFVRGATVYQWYAPAGVVRGSGI